MESSSSSLLTFTKMDDSLLHDVVGCHGDGVERALLWCDAGDVALLRVASVGQAPEADEQDHDGGQDCKTDPDAVDG